MSTDPTHGDGARDSAARQAAVLRALHAAGIDAVGGHAATRRALAAIEIGPRVAVAAVGKAAAAMMLGAREALGQRLVRGLVATKHDHLDDALAGDARLVLMEAGHPMPDAGSLAAGRALVEFVGAVGAGEHLLVLVSGGASALVEQLVDGITLDELRRRTDALLAGGAPIGEINRARRELSRIKGGKLLVALGDEVPVTQLLISDVPGDRPGDIGSGPLVAPPDAAPALRARAARVHTRIIASSAIAQHAVVEAARARGLALAQPTGSLDDDVATIAARVAARLTAANAADGIYVWGGEPTVRLPPNPGRGGRNQQLALELAVRLAGEEGLSVLVAATDGTDGPTADAGGLVDGTTLARAEALGLDARRALACADAGHWLEASGALVTTGPTGTNVMDLVIALRGPG